jgi:carboxymethylenebutenolidase
MPARLPAVALVALILLGGVAVATQTTGASSETVTAERTGTRTPSGAGASAASYGQTPHTGCQPGAIEKDGTCQPVTSGSNADIFGAENLTAITATNTTIDGTPGYLARPADDGEYPSVVMIHEWWGLNENVRHMADILAGHGYVVFAVDLYDGRVAANSTTASELASEVRNDPDEAVRKMSRATAGLRALPYTTGEVASLGWCFGGGQSLQLSLSDADLNATVIYYGTLTTNESVLRDIDAPVLGIFGAEDRVVDVETVRAFNRTLTDLGVEKEIHVYEGAPHAFANPSGESFRPEATKDAWAKTLRFLDETLKGAGDATEPDLREANVVEVSFEGGGGTYTFDVTLHHDDDGEAGYANWWQVERLDGTRLGRRDLLHAHSEQPFTRSGTIEIPDDASCVVVRGHDQTHGYGGVAMVVNLDSGETRPIDQGREKQSFDPADCP